MGKLTESYPEQLGGETQCNRQVTHENGIWAHEEGQDRNLSRECLPDQTTDRTMAFRCKGSAPQHSDLSGTSFGSHRHLATPEHPINIGSISDDIHG
jgi:hypothetical protein